MPLTGRARAQLKGKSEDPEQKKEESHLFSRQPSMDAVQKRIETFEQRIQTLELQMRNKEENKEVSLSTSKINYMDPRITVAWCKRVRAALSPRGLPAPPAHS